MNFLNQNQKLENVENVNEMLGWWRELSQSEKNTAKEIGAKVLKLAKENDPNAVDFLKEQGYEVNNIILKDAPF